MKSDAIFKFSATFDYYTPLITLDATGQELFEHRFKKSMNAIPVSGGGLGLVNFVTKEPMDIGAKIVNAKDVNGNLIFGTDAWVHNCTPAFDAFGQVIAYTNQVKNTAPKNFNMSGFANAALGEISNRVS